MPIYNRFDEVQAILKDASNAIGSGVLSGIIAHITSDADFLDADLDLYHFFVQKKRQANARQFQKATPSQRPNNPLLHDHRRVRSASKYAN